MTDTANSVMRLPYQLSDGSDILSAYAARTATPVETAELRITVGGWVSQTLLHTADPGNLIDEDFAPYISDKGYKPTELGPLKLVESLKKSQPLIAQYMPRTKSWTISPRIHPSVYDAEKLCAKVWEVVADPASVTFDMKRGNLGGASDWFSNGRLPILAWPETEAKAKFLRLAGGISSFGLLDVQTRARLLDPIAWFQSILRECGFRESEMFFAGYIDANDRTVTPGITEVRGPMDINGRCPRFQYPAYDSKVGLVIPMNISTEAPVNVTWSQISLLAGGSAWLFGADYSAVIAESGYDPVLTVRVRGLGERTDRTRTDFATVLSAKPKVLLAYAPLPTVAVESLVASTAGIFGGSQPATIDHAEEPARSSSLNCIMKCTKWRIAKPLTLLDFKIPEPTITVVRNNPGEMKVVELRAPVMGVSMPFEALRDAARTEVGRNGTGVDKLGLEKFLRDSEPFADAMVYTSFYNRTFSPVSMADVEALDIVRKAKKADQNILDELIDGKQTLRQLAKRVDADKVKGVKYSAFSNVIDEVAAVEDLVSAYVGDRLRYASNFVLESVADPTGAYGSITGKFGTESAVALTAIEASLLRAHGAVDHVPAAAWKALGVTDISNEDLLSYGESFSFGTRGALSWGNAYPLRWNVLTPREFCSSDGYPVADYQDKDTYTRMMLLFKGSNGDVSNMVGATLFLNTLGLES